ncbi:hypothetical protein ACFP56_05980 [Paenibacillus septentrionalis]|uniref:Uncharacterized protein n=1 Tax=Paenibacillus septentrionalis TaxID=429342 RepID=A0ABW1V0Z2_9BACL
MNIQLELSEEMYDHLSGEADFQGKTIEQYMLDLYRQHILMPSKYFEWIRRNESGREHYTIFIENMRMYMNEAIALTTNSGHHTDMPMKKVFEALRDHHMMLGYTLMELHKAYAAYAHDSQDS